MNTVIYILLTFGILCFVYYLVAAFYAGFTSSFLTFWAVLGSLFVIAAYGFILNNKTHFLKHCKSFIIIILLLIVTVIVLAFLCMEGLVLSKMKSRTNKKVDYVIILGAQIRGDHITLSLRNRLDAAYEYLCTNHDAKIICTGGRGKGENTTEAFAMKKYLEQKGIETTRIILEETSTSTKTNLKNARGIIRDSNCSVVVVTNNFHVYRSIYLAKKCGFSDVSGISAPAPKRLLPNYIVREGFALLKDMMT